MKNNVSKKMPSTSKKVSGSGNTGNKSTIGLPEIRAPGVPVSERQQLAMINKIEKIESKLLFTDDSNSAESLAEQSKSEPYKPARTKELAATKGWAPLHEACYHGNYNTALNLMKSGADMNVRSFDEDTPLHEAATMGHLRIVKLLVDRGADITLKNKKGKTPIDVASALVYETLSTAQEQLMKKLNEAKKSTDESQDETNVASGSGTATKATPKEEEDVYEFKTTPKDSSSSGDDKSDGGKSSDKSSDEKSDEQTSKRPFSDAELEGEDEFKRKKRKDCETAGKEATKPAANRAQSQKTKFHGAGAKSSNLANKNVTATDRKSPVASPKPAATKAESDTEADDKSLGADAFNAAGPKVPPLKIVIPQQTTSQDPDVGTRTGKNTSTRNSAALPYVVASSSNSNDSADKESVSSRCTSPSDSTKGGDEKKLNTSALANEDPKQQRVLRSSNRGGSSSVDRSSNNSSPQMQSSSPSPAPVTQTSTTTTATTSTTENVRTETEDAAKTSTTSAPSCAGVNTSSPSTSNAANEMDTTNAPSPSTSSTSSTKENSHNTLDLHPRKRKIRASRDEIQLEAVASTSKPQPQVKNEETVPVMPHPHDQPITNNYQLYIDIRKQVAARHQNLVIIRPKPPQGFDNYLMNRRTYCLQSNTPAEPTITFPSNLPVQLHDLFTTQEKERYRLKIQHQVQKEKLVLSVEQEIIRVHGNAARALANQPTPFSFCVVVRDQEVYNLKTPEQEEKEGNARSRYNGRLFLSWLQDVDDKWEKIKEEMVLRHHNEAEALHAVQKMDWGFAMADAGLCDYKAQPVIDETHVPIVHVSDDFDLLPPV